jgi:3-methylcrotonyl-CoA carboxylase alpha subunit
VADKIIAAARHTGVQAIHPGYGFLSENAGFAEVCARAGIVFIGPPPSAIHAMGSKSEAKKIMEKAKVPLVPGYHGDDQSPDLLAKEAGTHRLSRADQGSAGGGGKGMRVVEEAAKFATRWPAPSARPRRRSPTITCWSRST